MAEDPLRLEDPFWDGILKSRMCDPQVRFCESCGGATPRWLLGEEGGQFSTSPVVGPEGFGSPRRRRGSRDALAFVGTQRLGATAAALSALFPLGYLPRRAEGNWNWPVWWAVGAPQSGLVGDFTEKWVARRPPKYTRSATVATMVFGRVCCFCWRRKRWWCKLSDFCHIFPCCILVQGIELIKFPVL